MILSFVKVLKNSQYWKENKPFNIHRTMNYDDVIADSVKNGQSMHTWFINMILVVVVW